MNADQFSPEGLDTHVQRVAEAKRPTDIFKALLEGSRLAAPRAAIFLVRQNEIKGWGSTGYGSEAAQRQQAHLSPADSGWLGRLNASAEPLDEQDSIGGDLDFGQPPSTEWFGVPVRVKNRSIALLVAERASTETPWHPALLSLLIRVAQLRLDLDLLRRKLEGATAAPAQSPQPEAPSEPPTPEPVAEPDPAPEAASPAIADEKQFEAARRYARLVATDIRLYNEEAVVQGRRNGDLVERLGPHLARGKETFLRRHGSLGPTGLQILHEAYVQVLASGDEQLMPSSVLD
jgi:hypothetical protein